MKRVFLCFTVAMISLVAAGATTLSAQERTYSTEPSSAEQQLFSMPIQTVESYAAETEGVAFECHPFSNFCRCEGENSYDCDLLFTACDEIGGLFSCASDYGMRFDACDCEL